MYTRRAYNFITRQEWEAAGCRDESVPKDNCGTRYPGMTVHKRISGHDQILKDACGNLYRLRGFEALRPVTRDEYFKVR